MQAGFTIYKVKDRCLVALRALLLAGCFLPAPVYCQDFPLFPGSRRDTVSAEPREEVVEKALADGDRLHRNYRFEEALKAYQEGLRNAGKDLAGTLQERIRKTHNALALTDLCANPRVIARERFSRKDFFLFYPLKNQGWRKTPNTLVSDPSADPFYAPKGSRSILFSAPDATGARNLYVTYDRDTAWTVPALLGEKVLSSGNEVFPLLSGDGQTLYFASDGLQGIGGYDLYQSRWDESTRSWGEPVNLGFPYSSPADDLLLMHTDDGRYTLFASNRECSADSVYLYVLEGVDAPRGPQADPDALARLCALRPVNDPRLIDNASALPERASDNDNTQDYMLRMEESRTLRDSIQTYELAIDELRLRLAQNLPEERVGLTAAIADKEDALLPFRKALEEVNRQIRKIEESFLKSGVVSASERTDKEVVGASSAYAFSKNAFGTTLKIKLGKKGSSAGNNFRIAPMGRFAADNTLPEGIVYQIEFLTSPRHVGSEDLNGLTPVYERLTSNLRYVYCAGLFRRYGDALEQLNTVRGQGFPRARIVAFRDRKSIPVDEARLQEP